MTSSTHFYQMTTSTLITNDAANKKGLKALIGSVAVSVLLPLSLVVGATAMNAGSAEARTCNTSCYNYGCTTTCY